MLAIQSLQRFYNVFFCKSLCVHHPENPMGCGFVDMVYFPVCGWWGVTYSYLHVVHPGQHLVLQKCLQLLAHDPQKIK